MTWRERHLRAVHELEQAAAEVMLTALDQVLADVQAGFAAVTAAAEDEPAEPTASLDDLAKIQTQWTVAVDGQILPWFGTVFEAGAIGAEEQITELLRIEVPEGDPLLLNEAATRHLATARNRFLSVGDETWTKARGELLEGFAAGEDIDSIRRRLQEVTGLSRARAEAVARTEVISAANAGSVARVRLMGDDAPPCRQWLSTLDGRTRPTHVAADGQVVGRDEKFQVGIASLDYPGDPMGPNDEIMQCRCTLLFIDEPEPIGVEGRQQGGITEEVAPLVAASVDSTTGEEHTQAMIALIPEQAAIDKLVVPDGEPAEEIHLTLQFLGEAADIPPELRQAVLAEVKHRAGYNLTMLEGEAFAASVFNPDEDCCIVLGFGGVPLEKVRDEMHQAVLNAPGNVDGVVPDWEVPEQHVPWVPHITLAYTDDHARITEAIERLGPVMFDRVRVAFGPEVHDFPLGHEVTLPSGAVIRAAVTQEDREMPWDIREGGEDCAFEVVNSETGEPVEGGCHDTREEAEEHRAALYANEPDAATKGPVKPAPNGQCPPGFHKMPNGECMPDEDMAAATLSPLPGEHFHAIMHTQGKSTGKRTFLNLDWREPPFSYHWQKSSSAHGGMPDVVPVGLVTRVVPDGDVLHAWGPIDLDSADGAEHGRRLVAGFDRWVSIGLDEQPTNIEVVWPEGFEDEDNPMSALFAEPEQIIFDGGRVGELTAVSVPAQDDAYLEPTPELVKIMEDKREDAAMVVTAAVTGSTDLPVAERDHPWDGSAAAGRVFDAYTDGDRLDTTAVARAFLYRDPDQDPQNRGAWKLGFADIVGGQLQIVPRGVAATAGGRGVDAADIPEDEKSRIRSKVCSLYSKVRAKHDDWPECPFDSNAASEPPVFADVVQGLAAAAWRIEIPELAPRWWFDEPTDVELTSALCITDEGRIYGALAPLGVGHRAFAGSGRRLEVPFGNVDYSRFMGGWAMTSAGRIAAGPVTMDCGHADRFRLDHDVAPAHYDNTCTVVGKIRVGESKQRGVVWVAGALEPGVMPDEVSRMLACRLSGDWQPHPDRPGWQELVAALLVPSPGFPMENRGASLSVASEQLTDGVLVASSVRTQVPVQAVGTTERPGLRVDLANRRVTRIEQAAG